MNYNTNNLAMYKVEALRFNEKKQEMEVTFEREREFDSDEAALAWARIVAPKSTKLKLYRVVGSGVVLPPPPPKVTLFNIEAGAKPA